MISQPSISIFLDTRRAKANGLFPVKLRVYSPQLGKKKLYPTIFDMSDQEFASVWLTIKPRKEYQEQRRKLSSVENHANEVAAQLKIFSFEQFERRLFQKSGSREDIICHYNEMIACLRENNQFGNASNYQLSLKSLLDFVQHRTGKKPTKLLFGEITKDWLLKYESDMLNRLNRSRTTVSMYLRALRAIFNSAIQQGDISTEIYPFGKTQYQIPNVRKVKKALKKEDLRTLMDAEATTPEQEKARDFWFFSYACNGINIKDIALLRWENLQANTISFYRAKTVNTSKSDLKQVSANLNEFSARIIEKYGSKHRNPKSLIFSIISEELSEEQQHFAIKNFTRFVNQNLKKLAVKAGLTAEISSYWARHSFATNAIRMGASMEMVSEAVGHSNLRTTQGYFAGFEENSKQELANLIMNF
jgi:integrase/recombinase XerD